MPRLSNEMTHTSAGGQADLDEEGRLDFVSSGRRRPRKFLQEPPCVSGSAWDVLSHSQNNPNPSPAIRNAILQDIVFHARIMLSEHLKIPYQLPLFVILTL